MSAPSVPALPVGRWGHPTGRPLLSDDVRALVGQALGIDTEQTLALPAPAPTPSRLADEAKQALADAAPLLDDDATRLQHALGSSYLDLLAARADAPVPAPDAVLRPTSHEEVVAALRAATEHGVAVVPFGGGTSVVGGVAPIRGDHAAVVALDLRALSGLLDLDETSRVARFGAGTLAPDADAALAEHGLTIGHVPQSYERATLGGFAATRSAGQASTGIGRFEDLVEELVVATPTGELRLGRAPASAAGPDLRQLLLGSEGTLGVITELTVRVRPLPAQRLVEGWTVQDFQTGADTLRRLVQEGIAPDIARLSDEAATALGVATAGEAGGGGCLLLLGWEGEPELVAERRARAVALVDGEPLGEEAGAAWLEGRFRGPHLRDELVDLGVLVETLETATSWADLHAVHQAVAGAITEALTQDTDAVALVGCHVSHLYEGGASLYFTAISRADADDPAAQWRAAKRAAGDAIAAHGATITHHHAVGADHAPWMAAEVGELGLEALRAVKARLDPAGVLNPGKLGL